MARMEPPLRSGTMRRALPNWRCWAIACFAYATKTVYDNIERVLDALLAFIEEGD